MKFFSIIFIWFSGKVNGKVLKNSSKGIQERRISIEREVFDLIGILEYARTHQPVVPTMNDEQIF